ncbi:hypothetical protein D3C72_2376170 [compost metagenome]
MVLVTDHDGCQGAILDAGQARQRGLEQRLITAEGEELLRVHGTRKRPESGAGATRKYYGDHVISLLLIRFKSYL